MAIYHLEAKMVSRGAGRSAVAAAAYLSCSRMLHEDMERQAVRRMVRQAQNVSHKKKYNEQER